MSRRPTTSLTYQPFRHHRDALFGRRTVTPFHGSESTHNLSDYIDLDEPDLVTRDMHVLSATLDDIEHEHDDHNNNNNNNNHCNYNDYSTGYKMSPSSC